MSQILILHGEINPDAPSDEQDTLVQVRAIKSALESLGHRVQSASAGLNLAHLRDELRRYAPQVVFNLVETLDGKMSLTPAVPLLLEALRIPFTGCSSAALTLTTDKCLTKETLLHAHIKTPAWWDPRCACAQSLLYPVTAIVKSIHEDGSIGLDDNSVREFSDEVAVCRALKDAATRHGGEWFAEEFVSGREFNLSILETEQGPTVLPIAEIEFKDYPPGKPCLVGYAAKWDDDSFESTHTVRRTEFPPSDGALLEELSNSALRCWSIFKLSGYARVDFRVDSHGTPYILEVNGNPGIAPDAGFTSAASRAGMSYEQMVSQILAAAR